MTNLLRDGDYVPDGFGGFVRLEGKEELLAEALFRLTARRGGFTLLPELGSELYTLSREKASSQQMLAKSYSTQALAPLGLEVETVTVEPTTERMEKIYITLLDAGNSTTLEVYA